LCKNQFIQAIKYLHLVCNFSYSQTPILLYQLMHFCHRSQGVQSGGLSGIMINFSQCPSFLKLSESYICYCRN